MRIDHTYNEADPEVGMRDDRHRVTVEIDTTSMQIADAIRAAVEQLSELADHLAATYGGEAYDEEGQ